MVWNWLQCRMAVISASDFRVGRRWRSRPQKCSQSDGFCGTSLSHASRYLEEAQKERETKHALRKICSALKLLILLVLLACLRCPIWFSTSLIHICTQGEVCCIISKRSHTNWGTRRQSYLSCASLPPPQMCGRVHCTTSDSRSRRKFPGCAHTQEHTHKNTHKCLWQEQIAHCLKCSEGRPNLVLVLVTLRFSHTAKLDSLMQMDHSDPSQAHCMAHILTLSGVKRGW